jgi:soluble lytic murein transglycosylase-like protein
MKNSTFFAAALAAGLMNFAVIANDASAASPKSDVESAAGKATGVAKGAAKDASAEIDATKTASIGEEGKKPAEAEVKAERPVGKYGAIIERYASSYGVPVSLAHAVISVESNYRADARGKAGEVGLMQIKPATARMMGYDGTTKALFNPETNIKYGMKYLAKAHRLGGGTTCGTILKYNAGHGAKRMNPVSSAYCKKVKLHLAGL